VVTISKQKLLRHFAAKFLTSSLPIHEAASLRSL
jgi:hypothetical protein